MGAGVGRESVLRAYGGVDGDERVARRREALMDAALDMLGAEDAGSVTVRGVCRASGLHPRYFYESFPGVDALIEATYDRVIAQISASALAAFGVGDTLVEKVRGAVAAIVEIIDDDRRTGRLLFSTSLVSPVLARKRGESTSLFAALTVHAAADELAHRVDPAALGPMALGAAHFQVGGLARLLSAWLDGEVELGRDGVVELSVGLMMALVEVLAAGR